MENYEKYAEKDYTNRILKCAYSLFYWVIVLIKGSKPVPILSTDTECNTYLFANPGSYDSSENFRL